MFRLTIAPAPTWPLAKRTNHWNTFELMFRTQSSEWYPDKKKWLGWGSGRVPYHDAISGWSSQQEDRERACTSPVEIFLHCSLRRLLRARGRYSIFHVTSKTACHSDYCIQTKLTTPWSHHLWHHLLKKIRVEKLGNCFITRHWLRTIKKFPIRSSATTEGSLNWTNFIYTGLLYQY